MCTDPRPIIAPGSAEQALQCGSRSESSGSTCRSKHPYNILHRGRHQRGATCTPSSLQEVGVAAGIGTTPVSIVDRAEVPGGPYKPNLLMNLLIGIVAGMAAGLTAAMVLEIMNDTIKTREDVRSKLGLACLGAIPKRRGKGTLIEDFNDPASPVSEAYSAVLAGLRFTTTAGAPGPCSCTSTRPRKASRPRRLRGPEFGPAAAPGSC